MILGSCNQLFLFSVSQHLSVTIRPGCCEKRFRSRSFMRGTRCSLLPVVRNKALRRQMISIYALLCTIAECSVFGSGLAGQFGGAGVQFFGSHLMSFEMMCSWCVRELMWTTVNMLEGDSLVITALLQWSIYRLYLIQFFEAMMFDS